MQTKALFMRPAIIAILFLQLIPLIILPPSSFSMDTQEWWLSVLLMLFALIATIEIVFRHNESNWPWDLIGFSQGFNIISRLMLIMPHATTLVNGQQVFNSVYVTISIVSMLMSAFVLWYIAKPETRTAIMKVQPISGSRNLQRKKVLEPRKAQEPFCVPATWK